ncbi:methylmalonyl Co-A mutase-associated GTPase MeaB [candidate division WOR-3 bacterium]|nr:methylmalonyl Co-A mutase-associated GTPase MeaB [candidate division WOR-3 bacterium]
MINCCIRKIFPEIENLSNGLIKGDTRSIAKALSVVENCRDKGELLINRIFLETGKSSVWGVTGPPGSGKSSLVDKLIEKERSLSRKVAVIAVDPTSPFSGGALLGDRLRMQSHATDPGVFIRSMASRGRLGGLSNASFDAVKIFDAAGFNTVIIETVGVGQSEIEIVELSDLVILVLAPGMGDDIQAMKAGIMEIGDIFVVNKKDKDGAEKMKTEIEYALSLKEGHHKGDRSNVVMTSAKSGEGTDMLHREICDQVKLSSSSGGLRERKLRNTKKEIERIFNMKISELFYEKGVMSSKIEQAAVEIQNKSMSPYEFVGKEISLFKGANK